MTELRTLGEAAAFLRVPPDTLRYWRKFGKGPKAAKVGKHLRYRDEELRRWVEELEQADGHAGAT
jgi:DNA-binding transcriptional MerR regulator